MFHGLRSCDFLVSTLEQPQCHSVRDRHARENMDKFTTKAEGKVALSRRERLIFGWFSRSSSEIRTLFFKVD